MKEERKPEYPENTPDDELQQTGYQAAEQRLQKGRQSSAAAAAVVAVQYCSSSSSSSPVQQQQQ